MAAFGTMLVIAGVIAAVAPISSAENKESVLHTFTYHADGGFPFAGLTFDAKGNLYGVSYLAGDGNEGVCCGVVFQLTPNKTGWKFKVIYTFTGGVTDGEAPSGSVVFDSSGNLYGTTQQGDSITGCGGVYELSPTQKGEWKETILYAFNPVPILGGVDGDGCIPSSFLVFDPAGNLYGTTQQGGGISNGQENCDNWGCGSAFKLSPQPDGNWTESVIHSFGGSGDGLNPYGGLVLDSTGNLWGTTTYGGSGEGTVFELTPWEGGAWNENVAFDFTGNSTGYVPYAGLIIDSADNLYGTTYFGGSNGAGVVFKMTPRAGGQLTESLIHQFAGCTATECPDGFSPFGGLVFDAVGNLYGTTELGGGASVSCNQGVSGNFRVGCGVVFKLTPSPKGTWEYSIVYRFPGSADGGYPTDDHLAVDLNGNIFGTTLVEGDVNNNSICPLGVNLTPGCGVVFEVTP